MFLRITRCDVTGMAFSYFNVYSQIQFPRLTKDFSLSIQLLNNSNIFRVSDDIFILLSTFSVYEKFGKKLRNGLAFEKFLFCY